MKIRYCLLVIMIFLLAACGRDEEMKRPLPTMAPTKAPVPTVVPTQSPMPTSAPTCTPVPTSTPIPTSTPVPTPTNIPTPTLIPEDYGEDIFVFDREYTNEWGRIEVCFWLKDKDGNPLAGEWCELLVDEDDVMIKSPLVVDYYNTWQDAVTDEEGKVEFVILEQRGDGDRELNLTITTSNSRHTEKICCVDPVRTVSKKPEVTVEQTEYIKLSWEWDYDARLYCVERKVNNGEYELIWEQSYEGECRDYDVKPGNMYHYRVYGKNHAGNSEMCEVSVVYQTPADENSD